MTAAERTAAKRKSMISRQELHAYLTPPHCMASSKQTMPGMNRALPMGSKRTSRWRHGSAAVSARFGSWKRKMMAMMDKAPIGRLI